MNEPSKQRVPAEAAWLGGLGAVPFVALSAAVWLMAEHSALALVALRGYGAVILSFLGGVHWGLAMRRASPGFRPLALSVVPSLLGWLGLLLPPQPGLVLLTVAIIAMLAVDVSLSQRGIAPPWYRSLRIPLSIIVSICLAAGALAVGSAP